jgi:hypothetical protein
VVQPPLHATRKAGPICANQYRSHFDEEIRSEIRNLDPARFQIDLECAVRGSGQPLGRDDKCLRRLLQYQHGVLLSWGALPLSLQGCDPQIRRGPIFDHSA